MNEFSTHLKGPNYANDLGLVDGEFNVVRSNDEADTGWCIRSVREGVAELVKDNPETGAIICKNVSLDKLQSWNGPNNQELTGKRHVIPNGVGFVAIANSRIGNDEYKDALIQPGYAPIHELSDEKIARYKFIFAPPTTEKLDDIDYDFLFVDVPRNQQKIEVVKGVKEEDVEQSILGVQDLVVSDLVATSILRKYNINANNITDDSVKIIRENARLRFELGIHFINKINQMSDEMPERVKNNSLNIMKSPNHPVSKRLAKLTSREAAVLYTLSMLDGTFDFSESQNDKLDYDNFGQVRLGQHRFAAARLLGLSDLSQIGG